MGHTEVHAAQEMHLESSITAYLVPFEFRVVDDPAHWMHSVGHTATQSPIPSQTSVTMVNDQGR
jgi:hypothetical protein